MSKIAGDVGRVLKLSKSMEDRIFNKVREVSQETEHQVQLVKLVRAKVLALLTNTPEAIELYNDKKRTDERKIRTEQGLRRINQQQRTNHTSESSRKKKNKFKTAEER